MTTSASIHRLAVAFRGADVRTHSIYTMGLPFGRAELFGNTFSP